MSGLDSNNKKLNKKTTNELQKLWKRIAVFLSLFVVIGIAYGLSRPAITMSTLACGLEEHSHSADCYDENGEVQCGLIEHVHDSDCYTVVQEAEEAEVEDSQENNDLSDDTNSGSFVVADGENEENTEVEQIIDQTDADIIFDKFVLRVANDSEQWQEIDLANETVDPANKVEICLKDFEIEGGLLAESSQKIQYQLPEGLIFDKEQTGDIIYKEEVIGSYKIKTDRILELNYDAQVSQENIDGAKVLGDITFQAKLDQEQIDAENKLTLQFAEDNKIVVLINEETSQTQQTTEAGKGQKVRRKALNSTNDNGQSDDNAANGIETQPTDMTNYITSITVSKDNNGTWQSSTEFTDGEKVRMDMTFSVPSGIVTKNSPSLSYDFPKGLLKPGTTMTGDVMDNGKKVGSYQITTDSDGNSKIVLTYNEDFANGDAFTGGAYFETEIALGGEAKDVTYAFAGTNTPITVKKKELYADLTTSKKAELSSDHKTIDYTIEMKSTNGTDSKITVSDHFFKVSDNDNISTATYKGTVKIVKLDANGINVALGSDATKSVSGSSFSFDLPKLDAGESYKITYQATPNESQADTDGKLVVKNTVKGVLENGTTGTGNTETVVSDVKINKTGNYNSTTGQMEFTITIYNPDGQDLYGKYIDDVIPTDEVTLISDPIIYSDYNPNNKVTTGTIERNVRGKLFRYTFPQNSTAKIYQITYKTSAPTEDGTKVENTATYHEDNNHEYSASASPKVSKRSFKLQKKSNGLKTADDETEQVEWYTYMTIPAGSFPTDGYLYEDTIIDGVQNSVTLEGSHYGISSVIENKIKETFKLQVQENGQTAYKNWSDATKDYVDITFHYFTEKGGTEVTTDNERVKYFTIEIKPKNGKDFEASSMSFNYRTSIDSTNAVEGEVTYQNKAIVGNHHDDASYKKTITSSMEKAVYTGNAGEWNYNIASGSTTYDTTNGKYVYSSEDGQEVAYQDGIVTYRILVKTGLGEKNDKEITIIDNIPEGMEYVDESKKAAAVRFDSESDRTHSLHEISVVSQNYSQTNWYSFTDNLTATVESNKLILKLNKGYLKNGSTYNNIFGQYGYIAIYYQLKITDPAWNKTATTWKTYTNNATWQETGESVSQTTKIVRPVEEISKKATPIKDESGTVKSINYDVVINPAVENLNPDSDILELVDTLNPGTGSAQMKLESIHLYEYSETAEDHVGEPINSSRYQYWYDENTKKLTMNIPDELACVLRYTYEVSPGRYSSQEYSVTNKVSLGGKEHDTSSVVMEHKDSGATSTRAKIILYKVDKDNYGKQLANVKFTLNKMNASNQWEVENPSEYTTDSNGQIVFSNISSTNQNDDTEQSVYHLNQNILYKLQETENPNKGYQINTEPYYFVWSDDTKTADAWYSDSNYYHGDIPKEQIHFLKAEGDNIFIENEYKEITVKKVWVDADGTDMKNPNANVTVQLHKIIKEPDGKKVTIKYVNPYYDSQILQTKVLNLSEDSDLMIMFKEDNQISGKALSSIDSASCEIEEFYGDAAYGYKWVVKIVIDKNAISNNQIIEVKRNPVEFVMESGFTEAGYKYTVGEKSIESIEGASIVLNAGNDWTYTWSSLSTDASYKVEEISVNGTPIENTHYIVSYNNNDGIKSGEIVITNRLPKQDNVSITINKEWQDSDGKPKQHTDGTIQVQLQQKLQDDTSAWTDYGDPIMIQCDTAKEWIHTVENLPAKDSSGNSYIYRVQEIKVPGYDTSYDNNDGITSGTITITNKEQQTYILPETGGSGTHKYIINGISLLLAALALLLYKNRRWREAGSS